LSGEDSQTASSQQVSLEKIVALTSNTPALYALFAAIPGLACHESKVDRRALESDLSLK